MSKPVRLAFGTLMFAGFCGLIALAWANLEVTEQRPPRNASLDQARASLGRGELDAALLWANDALKLNPADAEAIALRGDLRARLGLSPSLPIGVAAGSPVATSPIFDATETPLPVDPKARARVHLIAGRADLAMEDLAKGPSKPDPESNWLLSRAALQLGDLPAALAARERADGFNAQDPMALEPAPFAGEASCASCHAAIHKSQRSSRHAKTLRSGEALSSVKWPPGTITEGGAAGITHRFEQAGDLVTLKSYSGKSEGSAQPFHVEFAVGSGHHGVSFITRQPNGSVYLSRASLFHEDTISGLTPGFSPNPTLSLDTYGRPLTAELLRACLSCHTTALKVSADRTTLETADHGIGCERCHGPGQNHIKAAGLNFPDPAIARPKLATAGRIVALCGECHSPANSGQPMSPTDPTYVRMQSLTLPLSRCYTESPGNLNCVACHNPHADAETSALTYETVCLSCHSSNAAAQPSKASPSTTCPVSPAKNCLSCHMPKQEIVSEKASFTDHHIRVHPAKAAH